MIGTRDGKRLRDALMVTFFAAVSAASTVYAAGGGGDDGTRTWATDPVIEQMQAYVAKKDWTGAAAHMKGAVAGNPGSADYNNLYAYAVRKGPNPNMDLVFKHYTEALKIEPKHRGAHEYIGEAYLMVNNLTKAKEHLAALDRLCTFGCEEYTDLKKAVAAHTATKK